MFCGSKVKYDRQNDVSIMNLLHLGRYKVNGHVLSPASCVVPNDNKRLSCSYLTTNIKYQPLPMKMIGDEMMRLPVRNARHTRIPQYTKSLFMTMHLVVIIVSE